MEEELSSRSPGIAGTGGGQQVEVGDPKHQAEECQAVFDDLKNAGPLLPEVSIECTCRQDHGGYFVVAAASAEAVQEALPQKMRSGTTITAAEAISFS